MGFWKRNPADKEKWSRCDGCREVLSAADLEGPQRMCPRCGFHLPFSSASERIAQLFDVGSFVPSLLQKEPGTDRVDRLAFKDTRRYRDRLKGARKSTGQSSALLVGEAVLAGERVVAALSELAFLGGSVGMVELAHLLHAFSLALRSSNPLLLCVASEGLRLPEGAAVTWALPQLALARQSLADAAIPIVSILCQPSLGPLAAVALDADLVLVEPGASIGADGGAARENAAVSAHTPPAGLPTRAEQAIELGLVDQVVPRPEQAGLLARFLGTLRSRGDA